MATINASVISLSAGNISERIEAEAQNNSSKRHQQRQALKENNGRERQSGSAISHQALAINFPSKTSSLPPSPSATQSSHRKRRKGLFAKGSHVKMPKVVTVKRRKSASNTHAVTNKLAALFQFCFHFPAFFAPFTHHRHRHHRRLNFSCD